MNRELFFIELKSRAIWYIPITLVALLASLFFGEFSVLLILMMVYIRLHQFYFNAQKMHGYNNFYFYLPVTKQSIVVTKNMATITCLLIILVSASVLNAVFEFNLLDIETQYDDYKYFIFYCINSVRKHLITRPILLLY